MFKTEKKAVSFITDEMFPYWKVKSVKKVNDRKATFSLELCPGLTIYRVQLVESKDGKIYVIQPQTSYKTEEDEWKTIDNMYLSLSDGFKKLIIDKVTEVYDEK